SMVLKELIKEYYPRPVWLPYILGFIFSLSIFLFLYQKNLKLYQPINCAEIYIVVFIGLLLSPTAFKAFMTDERVNNIENRELASMPDFSLSEDFAENFETYYNDNFGLRNNLIEWSSKLKINLFRSSPRPNEVKFGKSQFLFYNKTNDIFDNYTHRDLMTADNLNTYGNKLLDRKRELDSMGIQYVFGFWPNKHTIYSELLPYSMSSQIIGNTSLADQLVGFFKQNSTPFFDVRKDLIASKKEGLLYHKLDTHWNNRGAFYAYQAFCSKTYSTLKLTPYSKNQFKVEEKSLNNGDLTILLGVNEIIGYKDIDYEYTPKNKSMSFTKIDNPEGFPTRAILTRNENSDNRKKVLIFKDSFITNLIQVLSLHYYEIVYVHGSYDSSIVSKVKPDIVINCRVERYLEFL